MYRKSNYVLGATHQPTAIVSKTKLPYMLILGGAAALAFFGRKANRIRNALFGGAAAFAVGHFMTPKVRIFEDGEVLPPVDETQEMEDEF